MYVFQNSVFKKQIKGPLTSALSKNFEFRWATCQLGSLNFLLMIKIFRFLGAWMISLIHTGILKKFNKSTTYGGKNDSNNTYQCSKELDAAFACD